MGLFSSKKKGQAPKAAEPSSRLDAEPNQTTSAKAAVPTASIEISGEPAPSTIVDDRYIVLGKVVRIMSTAPNFRKMPLGEIDALIAPAITMGQVLIGETQSQDGKMLVPAAFALWASVSQDIDRRLSEELDQPWGLELQDWKSGDIPWLILTVGDERVVSGLLHAFITQNLGGKELKMRGRNASGKAIATAIRVGSSEPKQ